MRNMTEAGLAEAAIARLSCADPRTRQILESLIRHAHAFVREVELSEKEWFEGIRFLTETGHKCDGKRQEFILLSDILGVSMLVDAINHRVAAGATETTVLGPFFRENAPELPMGADIAPRATGDRCTVEGSVADLAGHPIEGAVLDVWQAGADGVYDIQRPNPAEMDLRARLRTGADGSFSFRTVKPVSYPVPTDGPVGRVLAAMGRHPMRPAHIHFMISAPGCAPLVTHLFVEGDEYLETDAVFGVKNSLVVPFTKAADGTWRVRYDFKLNPQDRPARAAAE